MNFFCIYLFTVLSLPHFRAIKYCVFLFRIVNSNNNVISDNIKSLCWDVVGLVVV